MSAVEVVNRRGIYLYVSVTKVVSPGIMREGWMGVGKFVLGFSSP